MRPAQAQKERSSDYQKLMELVKDKDLDPVDSQQFLEMSISAIEAENKIGNEYSLEKLLSKLVESGRKHASETILNNLRTKLSPKDLKALLAQLIIKSVYSKDGKFVQRSRFYYETLEFLLSQKEVDQKLIESIKGDNQENLLQLAIKGKIKDDGIFSFLSHLQKILKPQAKFLQFLNDANSEGETSLTSAIRLGNQIIVEKLIELGAEINKQNIYGETASHIALNPELENAEAILLRLLTKNPNLLLKSNEGKTIVDKAKEIGGNLESIILHRLSENTDSFFEKIKKNNLSDAQEILIDEGIDVNHTYEDGNTPLMLAVISGHLPLTRKLISLGADVNTRNEALDAPIHISTRREKVNLISALISSQRLDIDQEGPEGITALQISINKENTEIFKILIQNGADINKKSDSEANTPLHYIIDDCMIEFLRIIQQENVELDLKKENNEGETVAGQLDKLFEIEKCGFNSPLVKDIRKLKEIFKECRIKPSSQINPVEGSRLDLQSAARGGTPAQR